MDETKKKEIILQAVKITETQEFISQINFNEESFMMKNTDYGPLIGKILSELRKDRYISKDAYPKEYLTNFINTLISKILFGGIENVHENPLDADIFDYFFYDVFVYLILDGVTMSVGDLKLGGVTLKNLSKDMFDLMLSKSPELAPSFFDELIGKTCIEFQTFAEPEMALKFAENKSEEILDLIRYSIPFIYDRPVFVGLQGDTANSTRRSIVTDSNNKIRLSGIEFTGGVYNFDISDRNVKIMLDNGVDKISEIFETPNAKRTDFERVIILGVHWFADSQKQTELENEFLSLMICMEIFLTPSDGSRISSSISEAAAIILGPEDEREIIKDEISNFYSIRSSIVHGRGGKVSERDIKMLREYLKQLIPFLLKYKDHFNSIDDLMKLISKYKLSGGIFRP